MLLQVVAGFSTQRLFDWLAERLRTGGMRPTPHAACAAAPLPNRWCSVYRCLACAEKFIGGYKPEHWFLGIQASGSTHLPGVAPLRSRVTSTLLAHIPRQPPTHTSRPPAAAAQVFVGFVVTTLPLTINSLFRSLSAGDDTSNSLSGASAQWALITLGACPSAARLAAQIFVCWSSAVAGGCGHGAPGMLQHRSDAPGTLPRAAQPS